MHGERDDIGLLAQRAATALRELLTAAEDEATRLRQVAPPPEFFALARMLDRWIEQLTRET